MIKKMMGLMLKIVGCAGIAATVLASGNVYADTYNSFAETPTAQGIVSKSNVHGFYNCYTATKKKSSDYQMENKINGVVQIGNNKQADQLKYYAPFEVEYAATPYYWQHILFPTGLVGGALDNLICYDFINGKTADRQDSVFDDNIYNRMGGHIAVPSANSSYEAFDKFYQALGYKQYNKEKETLAFYIQYDITIVANGDEYYSNEGVPSNPYYLELDTYTMLKWKGEDKGFRTDYEDSWDTGKLYYKGKGARSASPELAPAFLQSMAHWGYGGDSYDDEFPLSIEDNGHSHTIDDHVDLDDIKTKDGFPQAVASVFHSACDTDPDEYFEKCAYSTLDSNSVRYEVRVTDIHIWEGESVQTNWRLSEDDTDSDRNAAAKTAVKNLTGGSEYDKFKVTNAEKIILYQHYIKNIIGYPVFCGDDKPQEGPTYIDIKWYNDASTALTCKIDQLVNNSNTQVVLVKDDNTFGVMGKASDIIAGLNNTTMAQGNLITQEEWDTVNSHSTLSNMNNPIGPGGGGQYSDTQTCYTGAGALGWIVCPIIEGASSAIQGMYSAVIEPFLRTDPQLFAKESGTYSAWDTFRNIANLAFVIIFLVVIFSQLTGFGIDNYGIKKILPKLIIGAILINVSYIICQLAIDIANIIGGQIAGLFGGLSDKINDQAMGTFCSVNTCSDAGGGTIAVSVFFIVLIVGVISAGVILAAGWQVIIPILLGLLSFVIAALFLFVILGIRQALAVLLVAVSPLAFVMYMLPNTKSIFDRWFKTLKALLLAYPICSALVYGGNMVSGIILSTVATTKVSSVGTVAPVLSAGIVAIAPAFLIPSVIRKSMGAIGSFSTRLQGGLNRWGRGKSERFLRSTPIGNEGALSRRLKRRETMAEGRRAARQRDLNAKIGQKQLNKYLKKSGGYGALSAGQRRNFMQAQAMVDTYDTEQKKGMDMYLKNADNDHAFGAMLSEMEGGKGIPDMNTVEASLGKLSEAGGDWFASGMNSFMDSEGFQRLATAKGPEGDAARNRFINFLQSQKGNPLAQTMAKTLRKDGFTNNVTVTRPDGSTEVVKRAKSRRELQNSDTYQQMWQRQDLTSAESDALQYATGGSSVTFSPNGTNGRTYGGNMENVAAISSAVQIRSLAATNSVRDGAGGKGDRVNDFITSAVSGHVGEDGRSNSAAFAQEVFKDMSAGQIVEMSKDSAEAMQRGSGMGEDAFRAMATTATAAERAKVEASETLSGKMKNGTAEVIWTRPTQAAPAAPAPQAGDPGAGSFGGGTWDGSFDT